MQAPPPFRRTGGIGMDAATKAARRTSIGGSDARIIMSGDLNAITNLWLEKRGEAVDEDLSEVLFIQLGNITERFNLDWFEFESGLWVEAEQEKRFHPEYPWAHATLDGAVRRTQDGPDRGIVEAKFMLPFNWSMDAAVAKYFPQVQHQLWVTGLPVGWLSVITGGGQWHSRRIEADFFYQVALQQAEADFWDAVQTGRVPNAVEVEQPIKMQPTRIADLSGDQDWAPLAAQLTETIAAFKRHDSAKRRIKKLFPDDAQIARGNGVTLRRGRDGRTLFDVEPAVSIAA
jgi:predicted phage-related endonuclease